MSSQSKADTSSVQWIMSLVRFYRIQGSIFFKFLFTHNLVYILFITGLLPIIWTRFIIEHSFKKLIYNLYSRHCMKIWLVSHHPKRLKRGYIKASVKLGKDSNEIFLRKVWYVWKQVNVIETSLQVGQQISKWQNRL